MLPPLTVKSYAAQHDHAPVDLAEAADDARRPAACRCRPGPAARPICVPCIADLEEDAVVEERREPLARASSCRARAASRPCSAPPISRTFARRASRSATSSRMFGIGRPLVPRLLPRPLAAVASRGTPSSPSRASSVARHSASRSRSSGSAVSRSRSSCAAKRASPRRSVIGLFARERVGELLHRGVELRRRRRRG